MLKMCKLKKQTKKHKICANLSLAIVQQHDHITRVQPASLKVVPLSVVNGDRVKQKCLGQAVQVGVLYVAIVNLQKTFMSIKQ